MFSRIYIVARRRHDPMMLIPTGAMGDGDLADSEAVGVCEHGYEAMQLAIEADVFDDLASITLEAAIEIVQLQTECRRDDPIEQLRRDPLAGRILAVYLPARNKIHSLVDFRE